MSACWLKAAKEAVYTGIECDWYAARDNTLLLYTNQHGVCIARIRVPLVPELITGAQLRQDTRDYLQRAVNVDLRQVAGWPTGAAYQWG